MYGTHEKYGKKGNWCFEEADRNSLFAARSLRAKSGPTCVKEVINFVTT